MNRIAMRHVFIGLAAICLVALGGCGGGGGGDTPPPATGVQITGVVMAPSAQIARLQDKTLFLALVDRLFRSADAATSGIAPVPGTTVTALRVDGSGATLATLGTATTDASGHYILTLPSGTVLAPTIIVRVAGGGTEMRAPVVQALVDITPASEWLMQELSTALDTLSRDDVLFLQALIESYTIDAGSDIATTLTALDTLHDLVADEIAAAQDDSTPSPAFDGTWVMSGNDIMVGNVSAGDQNGVWISGQWLNTLSDYTVTLAQQSGDTYSVTLNGKESETSQYAHGSNCQVSTTQPFVSGCTFQSYNWAGDDDAFYESKTFGPETMSLQIFTLGDGRLAIPHPAEETIEDGDMFAYVTPPYVEIMMPMGGDGTTADAYAGIAAWPSFAYDLNSEGSAADRTDLRGGGADIKPQALIKYGSGMGAGNLNGTYAFIALTHSVSADGDRAHSVFNGTLTADGSGLISSGGTLAGAELERIADNTNTAALTATVLSDTLSGGSYTVSSNGALTLNLTAPTVTPPALTGRLNGNGNFFYAGAIETDTPTSPLQVGHTAAFGIKVNTAVPSLSGKTYRFRAADLEYGTGTEARYSHHAYSTLAFTDASNVTVTLNSQEIERIDDITSIVSPEATFASTLTGTYTTDTNGAFAITLEDGSIIRGHVNLNARGLLATHLHDFPASGTEVVTGTRSPTLGIVMGRCTNC